MNYSNISIDNKSSLDDLINICNSLNGVSLEFDFTDSERNGCNVLIGGNEVIYHIDIEEAKDVVDLKRKLLAYENSVDRMLSVTQHSNYFILRINDKKSIVDAGYDKVHAKMIESSIFRRSGLTILSSDKIDTIPFTMKKLYTMLKNNKPRSRVAYITDKDFYIDCSYDIIFIEASDYTNALLEKIVKSVIRGVQVFIGVEAGNSMMALEYLKMTCPLITDNTLSSFNFINCMIHQKSLPLLCPKCSIKAVDNASINTEMAYRLTFLSNGGDEDIVKGSYSDFSIDNVLIANEHGCDNCHKGYVSETFCAEVIIPDYDMLENIRKGNYIEAWRCWRKYHLDGFVGMRSEDHAIMKMGKGLIDPQSIENYMEHLNIQLLLEDGTLTSDEVKSMIVPV